ncbi:MAG: ThuA domain-containing protein [Planctomycetaceae bacterium]|nr:ThuA domain-containing protein [Planctomycetaceae bacterium]
MRPYLLTALLGLTALTASAADPIKVLIVDGQNNHKNWPQTTPMMKQYLEQTGLFTVDVATTAPNGIDSKFKPEFAKYRVVLSNYNGADWPKETEQAFEQFVKTGGGFVCVHAADNSFPNWTAYNEMIGVGGWGGRNEKSGPYLYTKEDGTIVRDTSPGAGGHHGAQHPFAVVVRDREHPITKGMPKEWMHVKDELYDKLRGPATNVQLLATAFADPEKGGSGRHEPMLFTVTYGKGRVFHTPMGHGNDSQECVGFIATIQRGTEWAATGQVTQPIPADFPKADAISQRTFVAK